MEEVTGEIIEPAAIYARAGGIFYISPSGIEGNAQLLPDGVFVNRQLFEKSLAVGAIRAGAEVMLQTKAIDLFKENGVVKGVVVRNESGMTTIPCSVVVAADGSYRQMGRLAGIQLPDEVFSVALGYEFAGVKVSGHPDKFVKICLDDSGEAMYRYIVPYGQDKFSICCIIGRHNIKYRKSLKQRVNELIRHLETIGAYDFDKASPVSMLAGSTVKLAKDPIPATLAGDGIILIGQAAGFPVITSNWGGRTVMYAACWTGRVAGKIAAKAVKTGDVSGRRLNREYQSVIRERFGAEGPRIWEAGQVWGRFFGMGREEQDRAVKEIGWELAALHFYAQGCVASNLRSCLEPAKEWLEESRGKL